MTINNSYLLNQDSPQRLKQLIVKFPQALVVFENIKNGKPLNTNTFFQDNDTAEIMIDFITTELNAHELIQKSENTGIGFKPLFSQIFIDRESLSNEDKTKLLVKRLNETASVFNDTACKEIPVFGSIDDTSLSQEDYREMVGEVYGVFDKYRAKPQGAVKYKMTFACKEIK